MLPRIAVIKQADRIFTSEYRRYDRNVRAIRRWLSHVPWKAQALHTSYFPSWNTGIDQYCFLFCTDANSNYTANLMTQWIMTSDCNISKWCKESADLQISACAESFFVFRQPVKWFFQPVPYAEGNTKFVYENRISSRGIANHIAQLRWSCRLLLPT